jgi:hypothetical protein
VAVICIRLAIVLVFGRRHGLINVWIRRRVHGRCWIDVSHRPNKGSEHAYVIVRHTVPNDFLRILVSS